MAGLLYKELVLNKRNIAAIAAAELVLSLTMLMPVFEGSDWSTAIVMFALSTLFIPMMFLVAGMTAGFFGADESKKWAYFISASPVTQTGHIFSKYLFALLMYMALLVWCYYLSAFAPVWGGAVNVQAAVVMFWIMLLLSAVEFPFTVRFGSKAGSYVKTVIGTAIALIVIEYLLFGDISFFSDTDKMAELIVKFNESTAMSDIMCVLSAALPCAALGLYYLSYKISCKLFPKGAEEYER